MKHLGKTDGDTLSYAYAKWWMLAALFFYVSDQLERWASWTLILTPIMLLLLLALSAVGITKLAMSLIRRQWQRLTYAVIPPIMFVIVITAMASGFDSDWLRFQLARPYYTWVVNHLPPEREGKMMWGFGSDGHFLTRIATHVLVYDRSDSAAHQTKADEAREIVIRSLGGHFYLMTEVY